jgi:hypothetical protein
MESSAQIAVKRAVEKFVKKRLPFILVFAVVMLTACAAYADVLRDVSRLFELHAKLKPGMTIEALNEMLGPPAENHALRGNAPGITRYAWLHGAMGIEAYEVEGVAYRVAITLPCGNNKNQLRALDALTRQGYSKYGSMPLSDPRKNEYYWIKDGIRFAFSRYNKTTVFSSSTQAR